MQVLSFELGSFLYGIPSAAIQEVLPAMAVTPLPKAPAVVEGLVNIRGQVAAVLDIRSRFGLPALAASITDHLILVNAGDRLAAFRVERAIGLLDVADSAVEDARKIVPRAEYISGVARLPDGLLVIHDPATFLAAAEAEQLATALDAAGQEEMPP